MSRTQLLVSALIAVIVALLGVVMFAGRGTTPPDAPAAAPAGDAASTPASTPSLTPAPALSPSPAATVAVIPEPFRGEWNARLADCGTDASDTRLRITADGVRFYESDGKVRSVTARSDRAVTVAGDYAGEGETFARTDTMTLSASGDELTIEGFTRHRCP